jgi:hypothetical protein
MGSDGNDEIQKTSLSQEEASFGHSRRLLKRPKHEQSGIYPLALWARAQSGGSITLAAIYPHISRHQTKAV